MLRRTSRPELNTAVAPTEVKPGELYSYQGVKFRCIAPPRPAPDKEYTRIISQKYYLRRPINVKNDEKVMVARNANVAR